MGKGGSSPPPPDPRIGKAALENAKLGRDWLAFAKYAYGIQRQRQVGIDALSKQVTEQALTAAQQQEQFAQQQRERYINVFEPLQDQYIQEAKNYDTPQAENLAASRAAADVGQAASIQQGEEQRQMAAMGVNPASGRWAGINAAQNLGTAIAKAGAENVARQQTKLTGLGLMGNALNIGQGYPANANAAAGLGLSAGTAAMGATTAANQQLINAFPMMSSGFSGAMTGSANEANILQNQYNSELQGWEFSQQMGMAETGGIMSGIGGILGLFMGSSRSFKTDKRKAEGNLEAVKKMPVGRWRYKMGIGDGGAVEHVGPYAEDFQKATGLGNGKMIHLGDAIGVTMGAVRELAHHVDEMRAEMGLKGKGKIKPSKAGKVRVRTHVPGIKAKHIVAPKPKHVRSSRIPLHVKPKFSTSFSIRKHGNA